MNTDDISIYVTKTPSYLNSLSVDEEIILIHKGTNSINESYNIHTTDEKEEEDLLDITGSPLKVTLNNSSFLSTDSLNKSVNIWRKVEEKHYPLPFETGMKYMQEYLNKNTKSIKCLPAWCILDGSDEEKTVLLSAFQQPSQIYNAVVKLCGYLPKSHPEITIEALCNKHFEIVGDLTGDKQKLKTNVSCMYELSGTKVTAKDYDDKFNMEGSVSLDINWDQCCTEIPLDHSETIMTIQTIAGQQNSCLFDFWKELILLELYIKTLNEYKSEILLNNHWLPSRTVFDDSVLIEQVMAAINNFQSIPKYANKTESLELKEIIENTGKRFTWDITDQLWVILSNCSTYGALSKCLNIVFTEIANYKGNIYISDSNMTSMAQIVRHITQGKLSVFMLTGTQPIEILIEIGMEKIQKDFIHIFSQICFTFKQDVLQMFNILDNKNTIQNIRDALYYKKSILDSDYMDNKMKILGQLHIVLETLILIPTFWQLLCARTVFEYFVGKESPIYSFSDLAKTKLFEVSTKLPTNKVYDYTKTFSPSIWRLSLTSAKPTHSVKNTFHLSKNPIFPPAIYKPDILEETLGVAVEPYYHYTLLTEMINFIKTNIV